MINESLVPEHCIDSLKRYVEYGICPGSFLQAVLENDLSEAVGRADHINIRLIPEIVSYCYNNLPSGCWGSPEKVSKYIEWKKNEINRHTNQSGENSIL